MSDSVRIVLGRLEVRSKRTRLAQARKAAGHTQEGLAEAMGVERSTVTRWEAGATEPLPYQRARLAGLLGRSLVQLEELLRNEAHDDQLSRSSPVVVVDDTSYSGSLGTRSRARTHALLSALPESDSARPRYLPPNDIIEQCSELVGSSSVQMVTGPVGSGKTLMVYHLATVLADRADFQLHSCESWGAVGFDLAAEVLRYASLPAEGDALLALERAGRTLNRPCVVVVDGVNTRFHFDEVCRQVDAAARQMIQGRLKFLLVVRTPPDADVSGYPVLAAAARWDRSRPSSGSSQLEYWDLAVARRAWDGSRLACEPRFADLPVTVQRLVQIPVYMRLVMSAGLTTSRGGINPYRLVEHCVRSVLPGPESAADARLDELAESAEAGAPEPLPTLQHDLVHEYLLAKRLAQRMVDRGRSAATVIELNELAARAAESAADRGVFDFVVHALEDTDPELAAAVAVSPSIDADITLPFMLAVSSGAEFVNEHVLRSCAHRCRQEPILTLARALLATTGLRAALGANYPFWLIDLLRQSGPAIWPDLVEHLETTLDTGTARDVLNEVDLDNADEAVFTARYFFLIVTGDRFAPSIELLLGHAEWRVRAALAAGLTDSRAPRNPSTRGILDRLVADYDYKVRAAAADAIGRMDAEAAERHLATLLTDENWHVRGRVLHGLMAGAQTSPAAGALADLAARIIASNPSWHTPPAHIARSMHRFLLMHGVPRPPDEANDDARRRALLGLLREARTGWIDLKTTTRLLLLAEAKESPDWLLQREERSATQSPTDLSARDIRADGMWPQEVYRGLRGRRSVQIALDLHDLDQAAAVATAVAAAGADLIEIGDPLIKQAGVAAIGHIKRLVPDMHVIAEMMSADWGRDQVVLAAEAGADAVLLIGPSTAASVSAAVEAGKRLGVPISLDVPQERINESWIRDMERCGVDGFTVTTNIDVGVASRHPLGAARLIRGWTRLPVAVSGGFGETDHSVITSLDWDILIIGRSVTEALDPKSAALRLTGALHDTETRRHEDHRP